MKPSLLLGASRRGAVLVVVMLMTTVLAGLAVAGAMRTSMQLKENSSLRLARTAFRVTEAGLQGSVAFGAALQGGFLDYVQQKNGVFNMQDLSDQFFDYSSGGSFDRVMDSLSTPQFQTVLKDVTLGGKAGGYEMGLYCFKRFRLRTTSTIGPSANNYTGPTDTLRNAAVSMQASISIGPVPCGI